MGHKRGIRGGVRGDDPPRTALTCPLQVAL